MDAAEGERHVSDGMTLSSKGVDDDARSFLGEDARRSRGAGLLDRQHPVIRAGRELTQPRGGLLLAVALFVVACATGRAERPRVPSEEEALGYLQSVVAVVGGGDLSRLCVLGSGTCSQILRKSDPATVPTSGPAVIGTRVIEPSLGQDGIWDQGGRVLELCGRDGLDHPYYSEMLVFPAGDRLISTTPVFWVGIRIASDQTTGHEPSAPLCPAT
jgi:hypothetical protein